MQDYYNGKNFLFIYFILLVLTLEICSQESDILGKAPLCFMREMRNFLVRPGKTGTILATGRSAGE